VEERVEGEVLETAHEIEENSNTNSQLDQQLDQPQEDQMVSDAPQLFEFPGTPRIIPREEHTISRKLIDYDCLKVMYRLIRGGYKAFLVGGGVRDLLLGKKPKDFDIGTSAKPEEVRALFRNSRIIGRRFRMNQVYFRGGKIFEVATFRARTDELAEDESPQMLAMDNTFGDEESDALRRDLTINGLFYDPNSYAVIDYVGGMEDLKAGIIRIIGEPAIRIQEDPVRMIRAIRHAARNGFTLEQRTSSAIKEYAPLIAKVVKARVYDELIRDIKGGYAGTIIPMYHEYGLLSHLIPVLDSLLSEGESELKGLLTQTLERLDKSIRNGVEIPTSVAFLALCIDSFASVRPQVGDKEKIKRTIDELYREVGVTKRDREDMEGIVALAHQLFRIAQIGKEKAGSVASKRLVREAVQLMSLTANNEVGFSAVEFWEELLRGQAPRRDRHPPQRNRRRRR